MRSGITQKVPTGEPFVQVVVAGDTYTSANRLMRMSTDEQAFGSQYIIELDNSDEVLNSKDYKGKPIILSIGFVGETVSTFSPLWVWSQQTISKAGKLLLQLNCVDIWAFISAFNSTVANASYNQDWQQEAKLQFRYMADGTTLLSVGDPTLYATLLANGSKTILDILGILCTAMNVTLGSGDSDSYINTLKPPIQVSNGRTGLWQLMDMTQCYLKWTTSGTLIPYKPDAHATVYTFDKLNTFYSEVDEAGVTIPNKVVFWSFNETGTLWISGEALDNDSYTRTGRWIPRHYLVADMDNTNTRTQAELNSYAAAVLAKLQAELNQGFFVAPMHCSLELFDKVAVVDNRYTSERTVTGYVHRIVREYDRGVYRITVYLGGVAGGYTVPGGSPGNGMQGGEAPPSPSTYIPPASGIPLGYQPYIAAVNFYSDNQTTVHWDAGTVQFADGTTQAIVAGTYTMTYTGAYYFYALIGNTGLIATQVYSETIGEDRVLVAVAARGSSADISAYINNPFTASILINRDKVMNDLVTELQLADASVATAKIKTAAITEACVAAGAITTTKITNDAITTAKIAAAAITANEIASNAVTAVKIYAGAVSADKIAAGAVTADKIAAAAITAVKIDANAIDATKLAATITLSTIIYAGNGAIKLDPNGMAVYTTAYPAPSKERINFYYGGVLRGHIAGGYDCLYLYGSYSGGIMLEWTTGNVLMGTSGIRVPVLSSDPGTNSGYMYYNTTTGEFRVCRQGTWRNIQVA